jgi:adenosylhomocysteine nucleosidase
MTTAILSALPQEQNALAPLLQEAQVLQQAPRRMLRGRMQGQDVVLALSGIGKVAAASTATLLIERLKVQRIIFTGVAGGLGAGMRVGDVVLGSEYLQHDMDASPIFPKYELPFYGRARLAADEGLLALAQQALGSVLHSASTAKATEPPHMHTGLVISGDRFVSTASEARALLTALPDALCVEMEGAAVAQVCHDYQLPYVAVRSISDRADDSAHQDFEAFLRDVAAPLAQQLIPRLLQML